MMYPSRNPDAPRFSLADMPRPYWEMPCLDPEPRPLPKARDKAIRTHNTYSPKETALTLGTTEAVVDVLHRQRILKRYSKRYYSKAVDDLKASKDFKKLLTAAVAQAAKEAEAKQYYTTYEAATVLTEGGSYTTPVMILNWIRLGALKAKIGTIKGKTKYLIRKADLQAVSSLPKREACYTFYELVELFFIGAPRMGRILESLGIVPIAIIGTNRYYSKAEIDDRRDEILSAPRMPNGRKVRNIMGLVKGGR